MSGLAVPEPALAAHSAENTAATGSVADQQPAYTLSDDPGNVTASRGGSEEDVPPM